MEVNKKALMYTLGFMLVIILMSYANATTLESLGSAKLNQQYEFCQVCADATYITLSGIKTPTQSLTINENMTSSGSGRYCYNYTLDELGRIDFTGVSDGCEKTFATYVEVTLSGEKSAGDITIVVFSLLFIVVIFFSIIYLFKILGHVIQFEVDLIDTAIMVGSYLAVWIFYFISNQYLGNKVLDDLLSLALKIGAITHVILPIVAFMVSFIMVNLQAKRKARITY